VSVFKLNFIFEGDFYPVVTDLYKISIEKAEKAERSKPFLKRPILNFDLEIHSIPPPPPPKILVGSVYRWICGLLYFEVPVEK